MSDCPCEESLNILTNQNNHNQLQPQMNGNANLINANINAMNNLGRTNNMMNATNTRIVMPNNQLPNNVNMNNQNNGNDMNNTNNVNNTNNMIEENINNKKQEMTVKDQVKIVLYIIIALSLHEAIKFFINQSIRLNKGSSSRFLYYPVAAVFILVLINLF